jgi:hypothetical protein
MDFEYTYQNGTFWKKRYGEMELDTAKICLMIINGLSFIILFAMVCFMFSLFYKGLDWGKKQT